jgi:uncharacterized protein (DUF488 family)
MNVTICTIGFAGKTAEQFFTLLSDAGVKKLIDIRENRGGQLSGFAKYPDLAFFLERLAGIGYSHQPQLAPSPEIRKAYRASKDWAAYEASFLDLMRQRNIPRALAPWDIETTTALLCSEPLPEKCHRRLVADLLAEHLQEQGHNVTIRHLAIKKPRQSGRRKA